MRVVVHESSNRSLRRSLRRAFGSFQAVHERSFSVAAGEIFGFLGPNGAGKTTTIRMLTGLLKPTRGSAAIASYDVERQPLQAKPRFGYVADAPHLYAKLTGHEFLRFIAGLYGVERATATVRARRLLSLFELDELRAQARAGEASLEEIFLQLTGGP